MALITITAIIFAVTEIITISIITTPIPIITIIIITMITVAKDEESQLFLIQTLLNPGLLNSHKGMIDIVHQFLENLHWEREKSDLARKV